MARTARGNRSRKRKRSRRRSAATGKVRVKGHTRSPRGPDRGKKPVRVKGYRRKLPS